MENEKRLIDADALKSEFEWLRSVVNESSKDEIQEIIQRIENAQTVDAVEVVRCRECSVPHNKYTGCPKLNGLVTAPDFYCPFGKRKDGDGNG